MVNLRNFFFGKKKAKRYTPDYMKDIKGIASDEEATSLKDYLENDPDLAANVRRFIDNVLIESPSIVPVADANISPRTIKSYNDQLAEVRFYKLMRAAMYNLIWNGNAFFELKFSGSKLKEMYVIDPETIKILKSKDGKDVVGYSQELNGSPVVKFSPDEIVHISIDHLDSGVWGKSFIKSLKLALQRKEVAEYYLQWLIQNDKFSPIVTVKSENIDEETWNHVVDQINRKAVDPNLLQIINLFPEDKIELVRIFTTEDFDRIFQYIEKQKEQIMTLLQVPPIISGVVDNSNRSNSEIQARLVFYNTIRAFQNLINEELNYEMLKKLNWKNCQFKFPAIDQRMDVETLKLAKVMRQDLGFSQDAVQEYLIQNGFKIPNIEKIFDDNIEITKTSTDSNGNNNERPSRQPRDKSGLVQNEAQRIEDRQMGVSSNAN